MNSQAIISVRNILSVFYKAGGLLTRFRLYKISSCFLVIFYSLSAVSSAEQSTFFVNDSNLLTTLKGFGEETTGGLGGQLYIVTTWKDYSPRNGEQPINGTLRYGVEQLTGPTWIVFDTTAFPVNKKRAIYLKESLTLRDNLTIDGRGSHVSIRKRYQWSEAAWQAKNNTLECEALDPENTTLNDPLINVRSVKNLIVSHLDFAQIYQLSKEDSMKIDNGEIPHPRDPVDKECFGDVISIYNATLGSSGSDQGNDFYNNIWVNQSSFSNCGDECIGITRSSLSTRAYITVSNNRFANSYKGIIIGNKDDIEKLSVFRIAVSLYQNHFININQRSPRVENAYLHAFNNLMEKWRVYGVAAGTHSRVMLEHNVFIAGNRSGRPWRLFSTENTSLWARDNRYVGVDSPQNYQTQSFPLSHDQGGPWYYDARLALPFSELTVHQATEAVRARSGWKASDNDVLARISIP